MVASVIKPADLDKHQARAIASLSQKLHLPLSEVRQVYLKELGRLKSQARIHRFVDVLALSNTRSALSSGKALQSRREYARAEGQPPVTSGERPADASRR